MVRCWLTVRICTADFEVIKEDIAVVPQRDVLHDSLAVGAALRYMAELRLPPDLSAPKSRRACPTSWMWSA